MEKADKDGTCISPENYTIMSNYLAALSKEFKNRFHNLRRIRDSLLFVENLWHLQITVLAKLAALGLDYEKLLDKFIE